MSIVAGFLKEKYDAIHPRECNFVLLRELQLSERVYERLPHRLWMVYFDQAGAAMPYAILAEYDDERGLTEITNGDDERQITMETLDFWFMARRRMGDH